jgi:hypothetical protein
VASWGDLNARLNRLVREGIISSFRTNLATRPEPSQLAVAVTPGATASPPSADEELRRRVAAALAAVAPHAAITVEDSSAASEREPRNSAETRGR